MSIPACRNVIVCTLLSLLTGPVYASVLAVTVRQADGQALPDAVVVAEARQGYAAIRAGLKAAIDQRNLLFMPEVLVVRTGTVVDFPNSDQVRHQVYSFSGAKTFQLPLYAGRTQPPVLFDRAGIVTLGCNIHDGMIGYIYVSDSPWYGRTDRQGELRLPELPAGDYLIKVWHPRMAESTQQLTLPVKLEEPATTELTVQLKKPLRGAIQHYGKDKKWQDY